MSELLFVVEQAPEGGYTAQAAGASIFTEADTLDELRDGIRDAVRCHFDESERPRVIRLHFVSEEVITL
ncbi:MAG: 2-oxoisovalerate dehydrogenase [Planctomycetes bacterium DG_58]|nr:MAG: 2-oxoisovalerate dehydrogenase [Planctomycetes bacterium DG_58]KPL02325.1 MAG: 2-oxoisovalerate dehydrogenase [Planctomycetes bacterium SM23_65]